MKGIARRTFWLVLVVVLVPVSVAQAKARPTRVTITGPGLAAPLEITDPQLLDQFNPWAAAFIEEHQNPASQQSRQPTYEVLIYLPGNDGRLNVIYGFSYYLDRATGQGYVYLPGRGEKWYEVDIGTILLDGKQGRWHYAGIALDKTMQALLSSAGASQAPAPAASATAPAPSTLPITGHGAPGWAWILAGLLGMAGVLRLRRVRLRG